MTGESEEDAATSMGRTPGEFLSLAEEAQQQQLRTAEEGGREKEQTQGGALPSTDDMVEAARETGSE